MRPCFVAFAAVVILAGPTSAQQSSRLLQPWVHPGSELIQSDGYHGAETCVQCHQKALDEVLHSVHWTISSQVRNVQGLPDGFWSGMINRECALAGTTSISNWVAATNGKATKQAAGCGVCHVGSLPAPPMPGTTPNAAQAATVDCLVCHAKTYDWSKRATLVTDSTGTHWGEDRSRAAALSITKTPPNEACLRCHEHAFSHDYKRGTPFTAAEDVHAAAGLSCVTCHVTEHHKIAKGLYESDMVASDLPDVSVDCSNCHGDSPHRGARAAMLNRHTVTLACQTCHIPEVSGVVMDDWGKPVRDDIHGKLSALSRFDGNPSRPRLYVSTVKIEKGHPSYIWRTANIEGHRDAQSWMALATSTRTTPGAKIFPVRALTQILLFDKHLKMWQAPGMAFMKDNPQTADFPLLLSPNREVYNKTGDIKAAIDAGMKPYAAMGLHWSGEWMPMQVPGPSYISVNHAIKKVGLSCKSCHSKSGVMDFKALGFGPDEIKRLERER